MANNKFVIPFLQPSYSDKIKRNGKGRALHMYGEGGDTQRAFECVNLKESPLGRARCRGNDSVKTDVNDIERRSGEWTDLV